MSHLYATELDFGLHSMTSKPSLHIQIREDGQLKFRTDPRISFADRRRLLAHLRCWLSGVIRQPSGPMTIPSALDQSRQSESAVAVRPLLQLHFSETEKWRKWFSDAFAAMQQQACRVIAKEWIKTIHPRKQSSHPYNGILYGKNNGHRLDSRPEYWPHDIEHKEPDHISKASRIKLLTHLIMTTPHIERTTNLASLRYHHAESLMRVIAGRSQRQLERAWPILQEVTAARSFLENHESGLIDTNETLAVHDYGAKLTCREVDVAEYEQYRSASEAGGADAITSKTTQTCDGSTHMHDMQDSQWRCIPTECLFIPQIAASSSSMNVSEDVGWSDWQSGSHLSKFINLETASGTGTCTGIPVPGMTQALPTCAPWPAEADSNWAWNLYQGVGEAGEVFHFTNECLF